MDESIFFFVSVSHPCLSQAHFFLFPPFCLWMESQELGVGVLVSLLGHFQKAFPINWSLWNLLQLSSIFQMCLRIPWYMILWKKKRLNLKHISFSPLSLCSWKVSILVSRISTPPNVISYRAIHPSRGTDVWRAMKTQCWTLWMSYQCILLLYFGGLLLC